MNVHDSEKVANLLYHDGYLATDELDQADLLIINTCSIREKAEHRLYSEVGTLREWKDAGAGRVLGVAGCVAQQQGDALLARFGHIDFVFGPQNVHWLPAMVSAATEGRRSAQVEESRSLERFDLPERHPDYEGSAPGRAYATVMEGCDMFCAFCIVPHTRGREVSRPAVAIVREVETLARRGVLEVTLLGQTVNAYGRHDVRRSRERDESAPRGQGASDAVGFAELLRRLAEIPGIRRLRYTSPHPLFYDDALIRAHAEIPALCPHVHLPVQSGSDAVLSRMRRRYTADAYRRLAESLRESRPGLTLSTDLIVGFPGETDADFEATLALVRDVDFVDSFSFKYSPRPGTAAAEMDGAVAPEVAQARLEELQTLQRSLTLAAHRARVGETTEILLQGPSRQGGAQRCGRDPGHRVVNVHFADGRVPTPGRLIEVRIVEATPHSLIGEWCGVADELPAPKHSGSDDLVHLKGPRRSADEQGRSAPLRG
jgi:tRNA-2-methylthio-N6-dimethylallyladenosine synthase